MCHRTFNPVSTFKSAYGPIRNSVMHDDARNDIKNVFCTPMVYSYQGVK